MGCVVFSFDCSWPIFKPDAALTHIGSAAFGAVVGAFGDHFLREPIKRKAEELKRRALQHKLRDEEIDHFPLGPHDSGVSLIEGNGVDVIEVDNITVHSDRQFHRFSDLVRARARAFEAEHGLSENPEEPDPTSKRIYNGQHVHITGISNPHTKDEQIRLILDTSKALYSEHMVTTRVLDQAKIEHKIDEVRSREEFASVKAIKNWRSDGPPAGIANGLPLNLIPITLADDKHPVGMVFVWRGKDVATAADVVACGVNENVHPIKDYRHVAGRGDLLDIGHAIERALDEELGCTKITMDGDAKTSLIAFAVDGQTGVYGLLGFSQLPITFANLKRIFLQSAKDRFETDQFIRIPLTVDGVCNLIHKHKLYNIVGVCAVLTLLKLRAEHGVTFNTIDRKLHELEAVPPRPWWARFRKSA
jgi:hypothetical protein